MSDNLFPDNIELDTAFLNSSYADDPETAMMMFETYLEELPVNLQLLKDSFNNQDIEAFCKLIHKQKPSFTYVGLTDLTEKFHALQTTVHQVSDLSTHKEAILQSFARIESATPVIRNTLELLRQQM